MAAFNKFQIFTQNVGRGVYNLHTDSLKVLLSNVAPVNTNALKADITEIAPGNGYTAGGIALAGVSYVGTAGVGKLLATDPVWTASGGSMAAFQYAILWDDTPTSPADPLIGWWDRGSPLTLLVGDTFTLDLDNSGGVLTLT